MYGLHFDISNPLKSGNSYNLFSPLDKTSASIIKSVGDNGSSCFRPLKDWKKNHMIDVWIAASKLYQ